MIRAPRFNSNLYPIDLDAIGMSREHIAFGIEEGELVLLDKGKAMCVPLGHT